MVRHIPCGDFVNDSERRAVERLKAKLQSVSGNWVLLSNLNHAQHGGRRVDEIDIVAIGPPGVSTIGVGIATFGLCMVLASAVIAAPNAMKFRLAMALGAPAPPGRILPPVGD